MSVPGQNAKTQREQIQSVKPPLNGPQREASMILPVEEMPARSRTGHRGGAKMPLAGHDFGRTFAQIGRWQGSCNDGSVPQDRGRGVRGASSHPRPYRLSLHFGASRLRCGPVDWDLSVFVIEDE